MVLGKLMKLFNDENRMAALLRNVEVQDSSDVDRIAAKLSVSTKTVRNDVKELNCLMGGYAVISNKKGQYKLIVFDQKGYEEIRDKIYEQEEYFNSPQTRMAYIFWQLMDAKKPYLIDDLSEEMKVGRTTTVGDLNRIREQIKKYDLTVEGKANTGLSLCGEEIKIRLFLLENVYEQIYLNYPLGSQLRQLLYDMQTEYSLDALGFGQFFRAFVVMVDRLGNGHTIESLDHRYLELYDSKVYEIADEFADKVEEAVPFKIPKPERIFLCLPIAGMRTPVNTEGIENYIQISEEAADLIIEILDRIQDEIGVTVIVNELFDDFVYHVFFMINRLKYGFHIRNALVEEVKDEYSVAYTMAGIAKDVIETRTGVEVTKDELGFLAMYFGVFLLEQAPEQKQYRIAIVCGSGKIIGRLIASQLKNIFEVEPAIDYYFNGDFEAEKEDSYDLIITTTNLKTKGPTPIIDIDEVFDKNLLKSKVESVKNMAEMGIPIRRGIDSVFLNMLDEERFFVLRPELGYEENVDMMTEELFKQGLVDDGFEERLRIREQESTMIFEKNIAFPHTTNKLQKLTLAFGVFPEKEKAKGEDEVQLVFLLAIPEEMKNDSVLIQLYDNMLAIAHDPDVVKKLRQMKTYRELLLYFVEENNIFK